MGILDPITHHLGCARSTGISSTDVAQCSEECLSRNIWTPTYDDTTGLDTYDSVATDREIEGIQVSV